MNTPAPANLKQLAVLLRDGEGPALEFKRSTGEIKEGMQTLCAFLNGIGGTVIFGIWPDGAAGSPPYGGEP
ncbi:MAG TPA: ATP-binding protein [Patescibacteria group bacterium]|nr:ATP-binding protein [Patescibacteria group bacterium]